MGDGSQLAVLQHWWPERAGAAKEHTVAFAVAAWSINKRKSFPFNLKQGSLEAAGRRCLSLFLSFQISLKRQTLQGHQLVQYSHYRILCWDGDIYMRVHSAPHFPLFQVVSAESRHSRAISQKKPCAYIYSSTVQLPLLLLRRVDMKLL